jgi:hypothetical protein
MIAVALPQPRPAIPTDEDTIALLIRLAAHYDDGATAGILNRRGRRSATGKRLTAIIVRRPAPLPFIPPTDKPLAEPPDGELPPVGKAADERRRCVEDLPLASGRLHRRRAGHARGAWRIRAGSGRKRAREYWSDA